MFQSDGAPRRGAFAFLAWSDFAAGFPTYRVVDVEPAGALVSKDGDNRGIYAVAGVSDAGVRGVLLTNLGTEVINLGFKSESELNYYPYLYRRLTADGHLGDWVVHLHPKLEFPIAPHEILMVQLGLAPVPVKE